MCFALLTENVRVSAGVAQLEEQLTCNQQVAGSSPIASSIIKCKWLVFIRRDSRVAKGNRL